MNDLPENDFEKLIQGQQADYNIFYTENTDIDKILTKFLNINHENDGSHNGFLETSNLNFDDRSVTALADGNLSSLVE